MTKFLIILARILLSIFLLFMLVLGIDIKNPIMSFLSLWGFFLFLKPSFFFRKDFFSWQGRINRKPFITVYTLVFFTTLLAMVFSTNEISAIKDHINHRIHLFDLNPQKTQSDFYALRSGIAILNDEILFIRIKYFFFLTFVLLLALPTAMKRLHDLNMKGYWAFSLLTPSLSWFFLLFNIEGNWFLILLIPVLQWLFILYLMIRKETKDLRQYGEILNKASDPEEKETTPT